jgi:hypothetical protein
MNNEKNKMKNKTKNKTKNKMKNKMKTKTNKIFHFFNEKVFKIGENSM